MADINENNRPKSNLDSNDVLTELEILSKKYGLDFDSSKFKTSPSNLTATGSKRAYTQPRNNRPAKTSSKIVFDRESPSGIKVIYDNYRSSHASPQGNRVIYQEQEQESIAEKRRRNAAMQAARAAMQNQDSVPEYEIKTKKEPTVQQKTAENPVVPPVTKATEKAVDESANAWEEIRTANDDTKDELDILIADDSLFSIDNQKESAPAEKRPHQHYETSGKEKAAEFFKSFIPWKGDTAKEVIRKIVMDISVIVIFVCTGIFVNYYIEHKEELSKQNEIENLLTEVDTSDSLEAQWTAIKNKYPDVEFPEGMNIEYAEIYAKNQDFVGWLHIDNTNIDTAIVHRPSDRNTNEKDFYLHKNFFGSADKYGNPYLDKYNSGAILDKNNIIHGHNMTDGLSFAQLEKYYKIDGFKESPIIEYNTLFGNYKFKVYAVIITNGTAAGDNGYLFSFITAHFPTDENFEGFIQALDERKLYDTGVDINKDDTLITLSTCSYEIKKTQMGRLAVIGRLVRDGESETVDTSLAVKNENVRYPQIWYDEHNMKNPYKDAYRWKPQ